MVIQTVEKRMQAKRASAKALRQNECLTKPRSPVLPRQRKQGKEDGR